MIHAELKLIFPRRAPITIVKNVTAAEGLAAVEADIPLELTYRPVEALLPNDIVENCEFVDRSNIKERFNMPKGAWLVREIELTPLASPNGSHRIITFTLVRP